METYIKDGKTYWANGQLAIEHHFNDNGELHNETGPALIRYDSEGNITDEYYYFNGKFHRENGPACVSKLNSTMEFWYHHGQLHRDDGPAIQEIREDGTIGYETWYQNGQVHRQNGPAHIKYDQNSQITYEEYYKNGLLHREEAPAIAKYHNGILQEVWYMQNDRITPPSWGGGHVIYNEKGKLDTIAHYNQDGEYQYHEVFEFKENEELQYKMKNTEVLGITSIQRYDDRSVMTQMDAYGQIQSVFKADLDDNITSVEHYRNNRKIRTSFYEPGTNYLDIQSYMVAPIKTEYEISKQVQSKKQDYANKWKHTKETLTNRIKQGQENYKQKVNKLNDRMKFVNDTIGESLEHFNTVQQVHFNQTMARAREKREKVGQFLIQKRDSVVNYYNRSKNAVNNIQREAINSVRNRIAKIQGWGQTTNNKVQNLKTSIPQLRSSHNVVVLNYVQQPNEMGEMQNILSSATYYQVDKRTAKKLIKQLTDQNEVDTRREVLNKLKPTEKSEAIKP